MIRKVRMRAAMNVKRKLARTSRTRWRDEGNAGDRDGVAVIERTGSLRHKMLHVQIGVERCRAVKGVTNLGT
jgi:hypothetical protein